MRKIVVQQNVSIDGVMQAPGGPDEDRTGGFALAGWVVSYFDDIVGQVLNETFSKPYDLLLGRKTYDIVAAHWPRVAADPSSVGAGEEEAALGRAFEACTKYVLTHHPLTLRWQNSEGLGSDFVGRLRQLTESDCPDLLVNGSSELVYQLQEHALGDEYRLMIFPIVLGKGKRLFGDGAAERAFSILKTVVTPRGVCAVNYARSGEIRTGAFPGT